MKLVSSISITKGASAPVAPTDSGHMQGQPLLDISAPSACLPEQFAYNRGGSLSSITSSGAWIPCN